MTYRDYDAQGNRIGWPASGLTEKISYGRFSTNSAFTEEEKAKLLAKTDNIPSIFPEGGDFNKGIAASSFIDGGNFDNASATVTVEDSFDGGNFNS